VDHVRLSASELEFVELVGQQVALLGLPGIAGRTLALLLVAPRALALEEIAEILQVSRASVSINTRIGIATGIVDLQILPGDRRKYYRFSERAFENRLERVNRFVASADRLAAAGLQSLQSDNRAARERLTTLRGVVGILQAQVTDLTPKVLAYLSTRRTPA